MEIAIAVMASRYPAASPSSRMSAVAAGRSRASSAASSDTSSIASSIATNATGAKRAHEPAWSRVEGAGGHDRERRDDDERDARTTSRYDDEGGYVRGARTFLYERRRSR